MARVQIGAQSYGPGLVVLSAAALALFVGPMAVREFVHAQTTVDIVNASSRLQTNANVLEQINAVQRDIAKVVEPSVVHVSTESTLQGRAIQRVYVSSGSGWVFDDLGHIVTNAHVVDGAERIQVQLHDGEVRTAELVGMDLRTDIAVVKLDGGSLHPAKRGDSDGVQQGDMVYAFGSPFDFRFSMSSGIVSGLGRTAGPAEIDYQNFIQVDAAINPGNSGGPLTDIYGQVIGMNTAIATGRGNTVGQGQFAGIGLAIPMSMIENVVSQLINTGEVRKGYLGVKVGSIDSPEARFLTVPALKYAVEHFRGEGAAIVEVVPESPADKAGLLIGDVIVAIDGRHVGNDMQVRAVISSKQPGSEMAIEVWRPNLDGGDPLTKEFKLALAELDPASSNNVNSMFSQTLQRLGFASLTTATEERVRKLGVPFRRGVLVEEIRAGSPVERAVPRGSIITEILGQPVGSVDELFTRVARWARPEQIQQRLAAAELPITYVTPEGETREDVVPFMMQQRPLRPE
jgi:serine protease Do